MGLTASGESGWSLEVVRGKDAGRVFAPAPGEVVLGHAPGDRGGIDLSGQEDASSPRRMAARHAAIGRTEGGMTLRDLESPGGTFVNRRRILPGQAQTLLDGDLIQLGGVQLRVARGRPVPPRPGPAPVPAPPGTSAFSYPVAGGPTCRSWDDFLTASAQRWEAIRDELTSGRLGSFLASVGRPDLAPSPRAPGTPDDRLDAWLGSLPAGRDARPELDVHPARLVIRATPGGGTIRRSVRVSNVGHRLLRSTARVEPEGRGWLSIPPEFANGPFATVEVTDLPVVVTIPETLGAPLVGGLVIEGNGGSKRVEVVLEARPTADEIPGAGPAPPGGATLAAMIARQPPVARVPAWGMAAMAARLVVGVAGGSLGSDAMTASGPDAPKLGGVALLLAAAGAGLGARLAWRRGGPREAPAGGFAGGFAGVVAAAALVAACRSIEPILGDWSTSVIAVSGLWAVLGAGLGAISTLTIKAQP